MIKNGVHKCDCCSKKIDSLAFVFDEKEFCVKCFKTYLKVRVEIGSSENMKTYVDVKDVISYYDAGIPF